jgi:hypothetical protein
MFRLPARLSFSFFIQNFFRAVRPLWYATDPEGPMTRVVSVGRSKSFLVAGALGLAFASFALTGCPGTLDPSFMGMGGTTGGAAGNPGTAGSASMAGTSGASCDITPLIQGTMGSSAPKYYCIQTGACHDGSASTAAGFSMLPKDWPTLVGKMPMSPVVNGGFCGGDATYKSMPYIISKSATGDGLIMQKLTKAICTPGQQMPTLGGPMSAADKMCFQKWATALANM